VEGLGDLEYGERLRQLQLFSIKGRLLRSDLVLCWKIVCGDGVAADFTVLFERAPLHIVVPSVPYGHEK
jgi:hypothetical protein